MGTQARPRVNGYDAVQAACTPLSRKSSSFVTMPVTAFLLALLPTLRWPPRPRTCPPSTVLDKCVRSRSVTPPSATWPALPGPHLTPGFPSGVPREEVRGAQERDPKVTRKLPHLDLRGSRDHDPGGAWRPGPHRPGWRLEEEKEEAPRRGPSPGLLQTRRHPLPARSLPGPASPLRARPAPASGWPQLGHAP